MLTRWTMLLLGGPADGRLLYWTPPREVRAARLKRIDMESDASERFEYSPLEPDPSDGEMLALWAKMQNNHIAVYAAGDHPFPEDVLHRTVKARQIDWSRFGWAVTLNLEVEPCLPLKQISFAQR